MNASVRACQRTHAQSVFPIKEDTELARSLITTRLLTIHLNQNHSAEARTAFDKTSALFVLLRTSHE